MPTDAVLHAAAIARRHKRELGYVLTRSLETAARRGELYVTDHGFAYVWHRKDGQTTLHAICSEQPGQGRLLLDRIIDASRQRGQICLLARCPQDNASNGWYARRGFTCVATEAGKQRALNVWCLTL